MAEKMGLKDPYLRGKCELTVIFGAQIVLLTAIAWLFGLRLEPEIDMLPMIIVGVLYYLAIYRFLGKRLLVFNDPFAAILGGIAFSFMAGIMSLGIASLI